MKSVVELTALAAHSTLSPLSAEPDVRASLVSGLRMFTDLHNELIAAHSSPSAEYHQWAFFTNFTVNRFYSGTVIPKSTSLVDMVAHFTNASKTSHSSVVLCVEND